MVTKKQKDNLKPLSKRTKSEQREICKKGGIASGVKRNLIKNTKEFFELVRDMPVNTELNAAMNEFFRTKGLQYTYATLNLYGILQAVISGNVAAMKLISEIDGSYDKEVSEPQSQPDVYIVSNQEQAEAFKRAEQCGVEDIDCEDLD